MAQQARAVVVGYLYHDNGFHEHRDKTVCQIVDRYEMEDNGVGISPCFVVQFSDGEMMWVYSHQLSPWYPI
jgi:hypothetical protein